MTIAYRFDVLGVKARRLLKACLPNELVQAIKSYKQRRLTIDAVESLLLKDLPPWSSPNVWQEIVQFYNQLDQPTVFEFGTGASTVRHFANLAQHRGGTYIGVESDKDWFWVTVSATLKQAAKLHLLFQIQVQTISTDDPSSPDIDVQISIPGTKVLLRLRASKTSYLAALDRSCDVVVIDGVFRKACIHRVLETHFLRKHGLLMLMECGRGSEAWWEGKLYGDNDYSTELARLLALGGQILHGNGLDTWPGCERKSPRPVSYSYPMEACKLIRPA